MIATDVLVIGQGISGTMLSWYLTQAGVDHMVVDDKAAGGASGVAAGIINPVTGRRIVRTWMIETLLPFAVNAYERLGMELGMPLISRCDCIDFFPTTQMKESFDKRCHEESFLKKSDEGDAYRAWFRYPFDFGIIQPCYIVAMQQLIAVWRHRLSQQGRLVESYARMEEIVCTNEAVQYGDIAATVVVFCDGASSLQNPWFSRLPFALNKGEALIIRASGIPSEHIYKKGLHLVPLQPDASANDLFWAGSSYEWSYNDEFPSAQFRDRTVSQLKEWLRMPFTIEGHAAAVRPATIERRPFVGRHPGQPRVAILNGMGTKGCSLSPYFAWQLVEHITKNSAILEEADVRRFSRLLGTTL